MVKGTARAQLKFVTSIVNVGAPGKKSFTPGKVMLHNQGASLLPCRNCLSRLARKERAS